MPGIDRSRMAGPDRARKKNPSRRRWNLGYFIKEGFTSIFRHGLMSFAAVCTTVAKDIVPWRKMLVKPSLMK